MKTYQDYLEAAAENGSLTDFILKAVEEHRFSKQYRTAAEAMAYYRNENPTITRYQKLLYTMSGRAVPDNYSANHKIASNVYFRFITQTVQFLLGYGVIFDNEETKERLGGDSFDSALQNAAVAALNGGVSFGFFNLDHLEVYSITEMVPLYDEETGALRACIRFWQLEGDRPLRVTLFEADGYTEYIRRKDNGELELLIAKRAYILNTVSSEADGVRVVSEENYPGFPIVPLYSPRKQSSIIGFKRQIDCHDLIESGFANDIDDASMIYWTISNAGGMDDIDLAKFVEHMKTVKAAVVDDEGAKAEAHSMDVPYQSRDLILTRLENEMYRDFMVLNLDTIASGNATATAIKAAYEPMNLYSNMLEARVLDFLASIFKLIGVDEKPRLKRDRIVNELEQEQVVQTRVSTALMLRGVFDDDTVIRLCAEALELGEDETERIIKEVTAEETGRFLNASEK